MLLKRILVNLQKNKMKKTLLLIQFLLFSIIGFSQSQIEMNATANTSFEKSDKELNVVYQKILKEYKNEISFLKNLKKSQLLWLKFRDAEMLARFPDPSNLTYGSIFPLCYSQHKEELTRQRINNLKVWLVGFEEGEMCSVSVKIK